MEWQTGQAYVYGQVRTFCYKRLRCCWSVSGPGQLVDAFVFELPGYDKLWATVTSALDLSAAQALSANSARLRQEDGFRDHKQRLGMEECRAWTKEPILRTFQVQLLAQTLLRLLQFRLHEAYGADWCPRPPWNPRKATPVDPRPATPALETPGQVFSFPGSARQLAKTSPNQIPYRPSHRASRVKS